MTDKKVSNLVGESRKLQHAVGGEEDAFNARLKLLDASAPAESLLTPDQLSGESAHTAAPDGAHISQKFYFFPPAFVALREELETHWPTFFHTVNPETGTSPAWCMVFDAPQFIGFCNGVTGLAEQLDSGNVAGICKKFLNAFRKLRGLGELQ